MVTVNGTCFAGLLLSLHTKEWIWTTADSPTNRRGRKVGNFSATGARVSEFWILFILLVPGRIDLFCLYAGLGPTAWLFSWWDLVCLWFVQFFSESEGRLTKGSSQIYLCLEKRVLQTNFPSVVLGQCLLDVWLVELASYPEMVLSLVCLYILWVRN